MTKLPLFTALILLIFGFWTGFESGWNMIYGVPQMLILGFVILGVSIFLTTQLWDAEGVLETILKNEDKLLAGGEAEYGGHKFNKDTELRTYQWVFGVIILTTRNKSAYYIAPVKWWRNAIFTLITFLFGWWAIPFGPFWTYEAIRNNLRGGEKIFVEDLIKYGAHGGLTTKN